MSEERRAGRDLDSACAEARGDVRDDETWITGEGIQYRDIDGGPLRYSTDRTAAQLLEDEIERRGLLSAYAEALLILLGYSWENAGNAVYALIRATPEQRARAFLKVVTNAD